MKTHQLFALRIALVGAFMAVGPAACAQSEAPAAAGSVAAMQASQPAQTAAPVQVTGLPDFTALVEGNAPAVVNITALTTAASRQRSMEEEEMPEFFRRFFGPPGVPGGRDSTSGGSGFIISQDGYILTNNHVVQGADEVTVRLTDRREFRADVIGTDPQTDIAVLKVDASGLPTVRLGNANTVKPGQWVVAIGSPFRFDHTVTAGVVSATGRSVGGSDQQYVPFIQTDVAINPGNSGGPLFNLSGEVIGINSQIFSGTGGYMGISFAIPIDVAQNVVDQLKTDGRVRRGRIGVEVQEVTRAFAESLGLDRPVGALVARVVPGSAADQAGIKIGDVILSFDGRDIITQSDLPPIVGTTRPGSKAEVRIVRDGRERMLTVTVAEAESDPEAVLPARSGEAQPASATRLGMRLQDLSAEQRTQAELGSGEGVLVAQVVGGPAGRAGLRRGDIVLRVGRTDVGSVAAFNKAVEGVKAGDSVMLLVRRGGANTFLALNVREGD